MLSFVIFAGSPNYIFLADVEDSAEALEYFSSDKVKCEMDLLMATKPSSAKRNVFFLLGEYGTANPATGPRLHLETDDDCEEEALSYFKSVLEAESVSRPRNEYVLKMRGAPIHRVEAE